jgi:hypothetical protein
VVHLNPRYWPIEFIKIEYSKSRFSVRFLGAKLTRAQRAPGPVIPG